jgi:hypothetical protein
MPRSTSQIAPITFAVSPMGFMTKVRVFVGALARSEPAAQAIYAKNAAIRSTGRNWLM